jgi:thioredoxin-like negative regulator of GroEL
MFKAKWLTALLLGFLFSGCGPDTIFLRPGLDTPSRHVANGHQLLERGKIDDACREFDRAKELDPNYIKAYVGLGVAMGSKGDIEAAMQIMGRAEQMAASADDHQAVQEGFERLDALKRMQKGPQPAD